MSIDSDSQPKVMQLYLEISQYPILARRIRQRMREELFQRGIVSPQLLETEVREQAVESQRREGLSDPYAEESVDIWNERVATVRDNLTDFYFAYNLPHDLFRAIIAELVTQRDPEQKVVLSFNPELAPWELLFSQGEIYENYPPDQQVAVSHHLRQIIVVLIKAMISDQLSFVRVAREYLTVADLKAIRANRIGRGKIGGKAAGMILAYKILEKEAQKQNLPMADQIGIPDSYYLASDVFYDFHAANDLHRFMNQKYKSHKRMRSEYDVIRAAYLESELPTRIQDQLRELLENVGNYPLIVRSSSLLEDSFETSFAGKYDSFFLPNQGSSEENFRELTDAIIQIYASVVRPEALIYREQMELTDYDERMAVLIQKVEGERHGPYFFPAIAGVGFSHNPHRWSTRIHAEDGVLRLVAGLGTRAVDRVGSDYPRMVALSHPTLRPESGPRMIRHYSQHNIDVLDLEANELTSLPVRKVLDTGYPSLGVIVSIDKGGYVQPLASRPLKLDPQDMIVTFDRLLTQGNFVDLTRNALHLLEKAYQRPVDIEFACAVEETYPKPRIRFSMLQCRPLSRRNEEQVVEFPTDIPEGNILFTSQGQVPQGQVRDIRWIAYVDPREYAAIANPEVRVGIGQVVGRLNGILERKRFILMGPGRWGSSNINLGVRVSFADIYNTAVLAEIAYEEEGHVPDVSYGTHFFQDLVEANIYPLPLYPDTPDTIYHEAFFASATNHLIKVLPDDADFARYIKLIDLPGNHLWQNPIRSDEQRT